MPYPPLSRIPPVCRCIEYVKLTTNQGKTLAVGNMASSSPSQVAAPAQKDGFLAAFRGYEDYYAGQPVTKGGLQQLQCMLGPGAGTGWLLQLSVAGQPYTGVTTFSFQPPVLTGMSRSHGPTAGGYNVTLTGVNFGLNGTVLVSPGATPTSVLTAAVVAYGQASITFTMPSEQGPKNVSVLVEGQQSLGEPFQYDPPNITSINATVVSTEGLDNVVVYGDNFGTRGVSAVVTFPEYNITLYPTYDAAVSKDVNEWCTRAPSCRSRASCTRPRRGGCG